MKNIFTLSILLQFICVFNIYPQTAKVLFINNNSAANAASIDFEVRVMPQDTVYIVYPGINFLKASPQITVPANTILKFNYYKAGTSTLFYSVNNVVYNPNEFRILFLYGTSASISYSSFTGYTQASSGMVKLGFRHSTPTLQKIDLVIRETGQKIADDFNYSSSTFGTNQEYNASNYTLDITAFDNNSNGLFAYIFPAAGLTGDFVYLFTSGTGTSNDMYMAEMNGTVTKLTAVAPTTGIEENAAGKNQNIAVYPNPAKNFINIIPGAELINAEWITIKNLSGQTVLKAPFSYEVDISSFPFGMYFLEVTGNNQAQFSKFLVSE